MERKSKEDEEVKVSTEEEAAAADSKELQPNAKLEAPDTHDRCYAKNTEKATDNAQLNSKLKPSMYLIFLIPRALKWPRTILKIS